MAEVIPEEAQRMSEVKTALVHGDYNPRNVIAVESEPSLLDFEAVRYGSPVFDVASSEFCKGGVYVLGRKGGHLTSAEMVDLLFGWVDSYPVISIEDGLAKNDLDGWRQLTERGASLASVFKEQKSAARSSRAGLI